MLVLTAVVFALQQAAIVPVGNYHAHLKSEASARLLEVPRLPAVPIPEALTSLIAEFEAAQKSGDPAAFTALFVPDGFYRQSTGWVRGRQRIEAARIDESPEDLRVRAHHVSLGDSTATIMGVVKKAMEGLK